MSAPVKQLGSKPECPRYSAIPLLTVGVKPRDGLLAAEIGSLAAGSFPPLGWWWLSLMSIALRLLRDQESRTEHARHGPWPGVQVAATER